MQELISSLDNSKIKNLLKLDKPKERQKQGVAVVEGKKEIQAAMRAGLSVAEIFYCPDFGGENPSAFGVMRNAIEPVSKKVFSKIAYRENPDGYIAIVLVKQLTLPEIKLSDNPLVIIVEGMEKPGNFGAILRTADAVGVDAVIVNDPQMDVYNANAIRASLGAIFNNQIVAATREDTIAWLAEHSITSYATSKRAEKVYADFDFTGGTAFVMGAEHSGLSQDWKEMADEFIAIPMTGIVDSLNLSVSAAVLLFEAVRQRAKKR